MPFVEEAKLTCIDPPENVREGKERFTLNDANVAEGLSGCWKVCRGTARAREGIEMSFDCLGIGL